MGGLLAVMKALTTSLVLFASLNLSFAQKNPNLDDPKVRDAIIAEAFDWGKLEERGEKGEELYYAPNQQTPYTGWAKYTHDNGRIRSLVQCIDGQFHGLWTRWYDNGQKKSEMTWKGGKLVTAFAWKRNGDKCPHTNVVDGNGVYVDYNEDGTIYAGSGDTFKDGELVVDSNGTIIFED